MNKDYENLAQLFQIIREDEDEFIIEYLNRRSNKNKVFFIDKWLEVNKSKVNINYQIPSNEYFKVNEPELIGYTALHFAVKERQYDIGKILLKYGADFTIKNGDGETVLHQATRQILRNLDDYWESKDNSYHTEGRFDHWLLSLHYQSNITINPMNNYGISHFHIACLINDIKVVQLFLESGESVDQAVNIDSPIAPGYTPLHFAVRICSVETVELLVKKGANRYLKDARKMSPLHLLIKLNLEILDYIAESDSSFKKKFEKNKKMISLLIDRDTFETDNVVDDFGLSCFHAACTLQDVSFVKKLFKGDSDLQHSVSKNSPYWPGYTAAHFAAHFDIETVLFLVKKGANMQVTDCKGVSPLDILIPNIIQKNDIRSMNLIVGSQIQIKNIFFSDGKTKLTDLMIAMQRTQDFYLFIKKVVDVNIFIPFDSLLWPGYTFLHVAVICCSSLNYQLFYYEDTKYPSSDEIISVNRKYEMDKIIICLKLGADVSTQDVHGSTAVHLAFHKNRMDIVDLLLENQIKICNPIDHKGLSHLHIACSNDSLAESVANKLLSTHANLNIPLKFRLIMCHDVSSSARHTKIIDTNTGSTPLHIAVNAKNFCLIEKLVKFGADVNFKNADNFTPIHQLLAVHVDDTELTQYKKSLLLCKLKDCVSNCGLSYLHVACHLGDLDLVEQLLDSGADVNATIVPHSRMVSDDFSDQELLMTYQNIIHKKHSNFSKYLIKSLASIDHFACYKPLHFAIESFHETKYKIIDILLRRGADIMAKRNDGSVIFYETLAGRNDRLKKMFIAELERNRKLQEYVEKGSGITMLHLACAILNVDSVTQLLNRKVDVNSYTKSDSPVWPNYTPLHVLMLNQETVLYNESSRDKLSTIMQLLLDHGADILLPNSDHRTPLHQSIYNLNKLCIPFYSGSTIKELEFTKILLKYHKDFNMNPADDRGMSHFSIACLCNDATVVESFLKHGVDVHQATDYFLNNHGGYTPLHFAVKFKYEEIVHLLLRHNANVNARSCLMETPLHIAFLSTLEYKCVNILLDAGANTDVKDIWGFTPLKKLLVENEKHSRYIGKVDEDKLIAIIRHGACVNLFYHYSQRGFIGNEFLKQQNYETFLHNSIFKAVIDAPDKNIVDPLGRTVIHNIVSVESDKSRTDNYNSILEILTGLGVDIDHQTRSGFTPLHYATMFENESAIESLLMYGADVNIVNKAGKVPYAYNVIRIWQNDYQIDADDLVRDKSFRKHFHKLMHFNLDLHILNKKRIADVELDVSNYLEDDYANLLIEISNESSRLQNIKIEPYSVTLYDFFSETGAVAAYPLMMKLEQVAVDKYFQEKGKYLRKHFPELAGILYLQYRKALVRGALIEPAISALNSLIEFELPLLCYEAILRFLKNSDLKNLISA